MVHAAGDAGWVAWTNAVDTSVAANATAIAGKLDSTVASSTYALLTNVVSTVGEQARTATTALTSASLNLMQACTVTTAFTLTLPTPVGYAGRQIGVRVTPTSTNLLTLATAAGNIDGLATRIMWAGEAATLQSDGTNWVKVAGKSIPMTCELGIAAVQSIPNAVLTTILLDTTTLDNTGLMSTLSTNLITVKRPGRYNVIAQVGMGAAPAAAARNMVYAQKNTTTIVVQNEIGVVSNTYMTVLAQRDLTLAAAETMRLMCYQTTGSAWTAANGSAANTSFLALRETPTW